MIARATRTLVVATFALAATASAQQPKQSPPPAQQPTRAAQASRGAAPAVSADSAKKVLLANLAGATVKSEHLRRRSGHEVYEFVAAQPGTKGNIHASVDATTGAFTRASGKASKAAKTGRGT